MSRWEYTFVKVDLSVNWTVSQEDKMEQLMARIAELGADGWEAVGQVTFRFPSNLVDKREFLEDRIMFKRPLI